MAPESAAGAVGALPPAMESPPATGAAVTGSGEVQQPTLPLEAMPPPAPPAAVPGVVVVENDVGRCAPLCVTTTTTGVNADGSVNEWGYENATPCVIPGTITARGNQSCNTGEQLSPPRQIVGEFGWQHGGQNVAWERILTRTNDLRLGYIAWSWWGNGADTAQLDMARDYAGPLTDWGNYVMTGAAGNIQSSSQRASIFQ